MSRADFICTAGGLKAMYVISLGQFLFDRCNYIFDRASGASSGSFAAVCALCRIDASKCLEIYERERERSSYTRVWLIDLLRCFCNEILPNDSHIQCNSRIQIATHRITPFGLKRQIFTEFESKDDLIGAVLASSSIPFVTIPGFGFLYRGAYYIDGVYPDPIAPSKSNSLLCINLGKVNSPPLECHFLPMLWSRDTTRITRSDVISFSQQGLLEFQEWIEKKRESDVFSVTPPKQSFFSRVVTSFPLAVFLSLSFYCYQCMIKYKKK